MLIQARNIHFSEQEKAFLKEKTQNNKEYFIEDILDILATNPDPKLAAASTKAVTELENHIDIENFKIFMNL